MLAKLRPKLKKYIRAFAKPLSAVPADYVTLSSLATALLYVFLLYHNYVWASVLVLLLTGFLDALDGEVARIRNEASPSGAFLDSFTDRVTDALLFLGLLVAGLDPVLVLLAACFSIIVSYTRARAESLGMKSLEGVGLMERADRIIALALILALYALWGLEAANTALAVLLVLVAGTAFYRAFVVIRSLRSRSQFM